ncbi:MAG: DoxX family membrane protein [Bryobacterales bacterium]|nr:DoxX family membrane protein [Bryobacterales bacterium]
MNDANSTPSLSTPYQFWVALLRIAVGWHFFYEGWAKLADPGWTAAGYLTSATGPLAPVFQWLGGSKALIPMIDVLNIWGLILIGLGLMLGLFIRVSALSGIGLLALYYLCHPPLFAPTPAGVTEGSYLIVNKNLVELLALAVISVLPTAAFGLDGLLARRRKQAGEAPQPVSLEKALPSYLGPMPRRQLIAGMAGVPFLGAALLSILKKHGWKSFEEVHLRARADERDTFVASATVKTFRFTAASELKGRLPSGRIGNLTLSRMILGGNLIGGWAHARDLIYVSKLVRAYHHRDKIFETFALAENCGVNTVLTNPLLCKAINDYWRQGGRIQFISDCGGKDVLQMIQKSIDYGACACYIQGGVADQLVEKGQFDLIAKALELVRANRLPAGIGGHKLRTIQSCVEKGLRPDFWMKTLHHANYWSAAPQQPEHDNIWCENAADTVAYMGQLTEPWIAFKILAAGAIEPKVGFRYAFESGADFICVGMYDFQIVDDVNLALDVLNSRLARQRNWYA